MAKSQRKQLATRDENGSDSFEQTPVVRHLGMWDAVSIIVGIVVGTAIFRSPSLVFQNVSGPWQVLGVWLLGGVLCLFGALCYAELATTYPRTVATTSISAGRTGGGAVFSLAGRSWQSF